MATAPIIDVSDDQQTGVPAPKLVLVTSNEAPPERLSLAERVTIGIAGIAGIVVILLNAKWIAEAYS